MAPMPGISSPKALDPDFSVSHQKVHLDIDLRSRSLRGRAELVINPHTRDLKTLGLNCRQCDLDALTVNGRSAILVSYEDVYRRARLPWKAGVKQYHMLQERLEKSIRDRPEQELCITIPKGVRLEELDPSSEEAQNLLLSKTLGSGKRDSDANVIDLAQAPRTSEQTARFTPITLVIEYHINRVRDGLHFVGLEEGDVRFPHAFTTNSSFPGSVCSLFPCLDSLTARCTWEISIKCAKTLGDVFRRPPKLIIRKNGVNGSLKGSGKAEIAERNDSLSDEDKTLELGVVCSGDMTDEIVDNRDPSRKTTSFVCAKEISAQHVGFAIGPFEQVDLAAFRESDEDDRLGQNAIPVLGFCLPGRAEDVKNTCFPLAKVKSYHHSEYPDIVAHTTRPLTSSPFSMAPTRSPTTGFVLSMMLRLMFFIPPHSLSAAIVSCFPRMSLSQ